MFGKLKKSLGAKGVHIQFFFFFLTKDLLALILACIRCYFNIYLRLLFEFTYKN